MKHLFIALLLVTAAAPGVASAQENTTGDGPTVEVEASADGGDENSSRPALEWIDNLTAIESARLDGDHMVLVIRSKIGQRVTLTDAGAVMQGGEVPRKTVRLEAGRNRVRMPVTEYSGSVAVTISTRNVLYAKRLDTGSSLITGPYGKDDVQNSALGGLAAGLGVTGLIAYRRVKGVADAPERLI